MSEYGTFDEYFAYYMSAITDKDVEEALEWDRPSGGRFNGWIEDVELHVETQPDGYAVKIRSPRQQRDISYSHIRSMSGSPSVSEGRRTAVATALTDARMAYDQALMEARDTFRIFGNLGRIRNDQILAEIGDLKTSYLGIPSRTANALARRDISTVRQLAATPREKLASIRGVGPKAMADILKAMDKACLDFDEDVRPVRDVTDGNTAIFGALQLQLVAGKNTNGTKHNGR